MNSSNLRRRRSRSPLPAANLRLTEFEIRAQAKEHCTAPLPRHWPRHSAHDRGPLTTQGLHAGLWVHSAHEEAVTAKAKDAHGCRRIGGQQRLGVRGVWPRSPGSSSPHGLDTHTPSAVTGVPLHFRTTRHPLGTSPAVSPFPSGFAASGTPVAPVGSVPRKNPVNASPYPGGGGAWTQHGGTRG